MVSRLATLAAGIMAALTAVPAQAGCESVLPSPVAPTKLRAATAKDLIELRDVGQPDSSGYGLTSSLGLSPDGHRIAFVIMRDDPESNRQCRGLVSLDLETGHARLLDLGGEPILAVNPLRGAAIYQGSPKIVVPVWSPDGTSIAYLRRDRGVVQAWVVDQGPAHAATHGAGDVQALRWSQDGKGLILARRAGVEEHAARIDHEESGGWLYDDRIWPMFGARPRLAAGLPRLVTYLDLATGRERPALPAEVARLGPDEPDISAPLPVAQAPGRRAWAERRDATPLSPYQVHFVLGRDSGRICPAEACTGRIIGLWWDRADLLILRQDGWANGRVSLYRWTPGRDRARAVLSTDDALHDCVDAATGLVCTDESLTRPRRIVIVDRRSGLVRTGLDLNPEFANIRLGSARRLAWRNQLGLEARGDLALPPDYRSGQLVPLVVVQYRSDGFLRGGTGDEYPIWLLAEHGIAVLRVEKSASFATTRPDLKTIDAIMAEDSKNWAERRSLLSTVERGIDLVIAQGIADPARIGITGLSDGATTVAFALLNGRHYAAAAMSTCCNEPEAMLVNGGTRLADFLRGIGYPAYTAHDRKFWTPMSLVQSSARVSTPLLMQVADSEYLLSLPAFTALREQGRAVEMYVFPDEFHIKVQPRHRLAIYQRNLDWFDFWLLGRRDPDPAKADQYSRWDKMRETSVSVPVTSALGPIPPRPPAPAS